MHQARQKQKRIGVKAHKKSTGSNTGAFIVICFRFFGKTLIFLLPVPFAIAVVLKQFADIVQCFIHGHPLPDTPAVMAQNFQPFVKIKIAAGGIIFPAAQIFLLPVPGFADTG